MPTTETTIEILDDLIKINNDRIAGYERAVNETKDLDVDLKALFEGMIRESQQYKAELKAHYVNIDDDDEQQGTTNSGKIYRAWMDLKATFTGSDRQAILASCEFGEDAWRRAYEQALQPEADIDEPLRTLVQQQYDTQKKSHDLIKKYRDAHAALDQ